MHFQKKYRRYIGATCLRTLAFVCPVLVGVGQATASPIRPDEARPRVSVKRASEVIGKIALVHGQVVKIEDKGSVTLIQFPDDFAAVIFRDYRGRFPSDLESAYVGKTVQVHGMVTTYAGNPQIAVASPDQISIVSETPSEWIPTFKKVPVGKELTLATFNILNLFDDVDDPYRNDDTTRTKDRDQLERIAEVIKKTNADVVALQEVENRGYLERFVEVFLPDQGYSEIVHFEGNDTRGVDVCLLSRVPVGAVTSHRHLTFPGPKGKPERFRRDLLRVELLPEKGDPFEVWVIHLKSNYDGRAHAEPIREAESRAIRALLDKRLKEDPDARIALCGDFNDTPESETVKILMGSGPYALRSFADEFPASKRITYNKQPYLSMIDFILVSPAMAERYVPDTFNIHLGEVPTTGSDHNAVVARFRVGG